MKQKTKSAKELRADVSRYEGTLKEEGCILGLQDFVTVGRYTGGMVRHVIEHNPFELKKLVQNKKIILTIKAERYLNKVYNRKKKGANF